MEAPKDWIVGDIPQPHGGPVDVDRLVVPPDRCDGIDADRLDQNSKRQQTERSNEKASLQQPIHSSPRQAKQQKDERLDLREIPRAIRMPPTKHDSRRKAGCLPPRRRSRRWPWDQ